MDVAGFLLTILIILGVVVAVAGVLVLVFKAISAQQERVRQMWATAAKLSKGTLIPESGPWYNRRPPSLRASMNGVVVSAYKHVVSNGKSSTTYTRAECAAHTPKDMKLSVYRKGALSRLGQSLGFQDVPTGDFAFDDQFMVKSNAPNLVPLWLDDDMRKLVRATSGYRYDLGKDKLLAWRYGLETDGGVLANVMEVASRLAIRGQVMEERLERLARDLGGSFDHGRDMFSVDGTSIAVPWHDRAMSIRFVARNDGGVMTTMRAWSTVVSTNKPVGITDTTLVLSQEAEKHWEESERKPGIKMGRVSWATGAGKLAGALSVRTTGQVPPALMDEEGIASMKALLGKLARLEIGPDRVSCELRSVQRNVDTLNTAIQLVGRLAGGRDQGPYRG